MYNWILPIAAILFSVFSYFLFVRDMEENVEVVNGETRNARNENIYSIIMVAIIVVISVLFINEQITTIENLKNICFLSLIWPLLYIDIKTLRIPNKFIILGLIYRAIIILIELLAKDNVLLDTCISELIAAAGLFVASILCSVCVKNSIGYGDIKLFIVLGLFLGVSDTINTMIIVLLLAFCVSIFLLITKKKNKKDNIAFAPMVVIGTFISIFLLGV